MKNIVFTIDEIDYSIAPEAYLLPNTFNEQCLVGMMPVSEDLGMYVLGETFLTEFYSMFDFNKSVVSFA